MKTIAANKQKSRPPLRTLNPKLETARKSRVLTALDAAHFKAMVGAWLLEQEVSVLERLTVDGKGLHGSGAVTANRCNSSPPSATACA